MDQVLDKVKLMALCMQRYSWEQGCLAQAFLELGDERETILLAKEALLRQMDDGRAAMIGNSTAITDPCSVGEALVFAFHRTGDELFKESYERLRKWALHDAPRNENGIVYHITDKNEIWADSFYMLPPFLASVGEYDEAIKQAEGYWHLLFNDIGGLLVHKWDQDKKVFSRGVLWGEGNGWAIAGMARIIAMLPETHQAKKESLIERTKTLIFHSLQYIRQDCFFHDVVNDANTCVENGFSQLLAYGIYRGVTDGWLDAQTIDTADKIYEAMQSKVDNYGLVQDVCSAKSNFVIPGPNAEGQAFFMLMCAARQKYRKACK